MAESAATTADFKARHWSFPVAVQIKPGTDTHYQMLTRLLEETYNPYKPAVLDWPELVEAYDIPMKPDEDYVLPADAEWGVMVTGYCECIDSFFAYGLFEMARRSGYFPAELVDTFEPVVQEEGWHILFFTNWIAWYKATMPLWRRPYFALKTAAVWAFLVWERIGIARDVDGLEGADANFTINGSKALSDEMDPAVLMDICLEEAKRLVRPTTMPKLARLARLFVRPKKRPVAA